jgi:hypothetical protein
MPGSVAGSTRVTFAYLGGDELVEETEHVDEAWLEAARARLDGLVAQAITGPYEPTPSPGCHTCDFSRFCAAGSEWLEAHR